MECKSVGPNPLNRIGESLNRCQWFTGWDTLLTLVLASLLLLPGACTKSQPQPPVNVGLIAHEAHKNIGAVGMHSRRQLEYRLYNTESRAVEITDVLPDCTCTSLTLDSTVVAAKGWTTLRTTFEPLPHPGRIAQTIKISYAGASNAALLLSFEAEVMDRFQLSQTHMMFDDGFSGTTSRTLNLAHRESEFQITEIQSPDFLDFRVVAGGQENAKAIVFHLRDALPAGSLKGEVMIGVSDEVQRNIRIPAMALIRETLVADPPVIYRHRARKDELTGPVRVMISRSDGSPFRIVRLETDGNRLNVRVEKPNAASHLIEFTFPNDVEGEFHDAIRVYGQNEKRDRITIPVGLTLED
jgi:hypothetical protein